MKRTLAVAIAMLSTTPALAETTPWGGVSAGINIDNGGISAMARLGVDTTISEGAFIGLGVGAGKSGAKDCFGIACVKGDRELSAELRLGAVTKGGSKFYGIVGYSNLKLKEEFGALNFGSYTDGGFTGGLGYELPLGSKAFLRSEFRYTTYGDGSYVNSIMPTIGFKF
jgi:opacity protein-like surface antigen